MEKSYFSLAFFMFSSTIDIESKRILPVFTGIFTKTDINEVKRMISANNVT